jgi:glycerate dehydrogenase
MFYKAMIEFISVIAWLPGPWLQVQAVPVWGTLITVSVQKVVTHSTDIGVVGPSIAMAQFSSRSENGYHHVIVLLEKLLPSTPVFDLPAPHTYELRQYDRTLPEQLAERIRDAEIIIRTVIPIRAETLAEDLSPSLRMIAVVGSGTDTVDLDACRARGIVVTNTPHCNTSAVAEHAVGLYFAVRRSIARTHRLVQAGEWARRGVLLKVLNGPDGRAPRSCQEEIVGILGYGGVGELKPLIF